MCDPQNQDIINAVVKEFITQSRAFTAFDVSLEAKSRGATERHRDMKDFIHQSSVLNDEMQYGNYTKTLVYVGDDGGNKLQAFLYHPTNYDPNSYVPQPRKRGNFPTPGVKAIPSFGTPTTPNSPTPAVCLPGGGPGTTTTPAGLSSGDGTDDGASDDGTYRLDHRNRLMIPTTFLKKLGLVPGQMVYMSPESKKMVLTAKAVNTSSGATSKMVERNGDVRIYEGVLNNCGMSGSKFKVEMAAAPNGDPVVEITQG